ncbi:hypothetical protein ACTI_67770 [Actinoplanes sp. OR16]|uniref:hypothetical protein n=1 Tax=Actinoplanes sp. OR16 TaxID=946334 RepID=UPI000F6F7313|nr:hypothetical protein [Actinoplanes sp. OR16]BBH70092.1 hypothetical protein ACTI_67770 [Actinoplanes sp. OR16]
MRWLTLYLRSRRATLAVPAAVGGTVLMWALWVINSDTREAAPQTVVATVLLLVTVLTTTLGSPDDALEATAAISWPVRRLAHLLAGFLLVVLSLLVTLATEAQFGPAGLVARDAAGLLGLTALGAAVTGIARAWFLPLGWTLAAILFPQTATLAGRVLTWQTQEPGSVAAAVVAGLLATAGLVAYVVGGPARSAPGEAAQQ